MPNGVMEALAMGIPVVSTDCPCGGPRMLIKNNVNGLLVPVNDANALAEKINYLLDNPDEANEMGLNARKIKDVASTKVVYRQWKDYLDLVLKG